MARRDAPDIPSGSWPRRMPAPMAAGYVGEATVSDFLRRVGSDYPPPRINEGERKLWLKDDLDRAIAPDTAAVQDAAEVL